MASSLDPGLHAGNDLTHGRVSGDHRGEEVTVNAACDTSSWHCFTKQAAATSPESRFSSESGPSYHLPAHVAKSHARATPGLQEEGF
jgi:hypothetical protein